MFSAYDLKKIIPRAIFALVLVNLSWGLMEIFIRGIDVIGKGAEELVMAPFGDIGRGIEIGASSGAAVFTLTAIGAAGAAFGLIPILGVAVTGLFGILFAFVITLIRRVFLIGLVIIAPVAIALSVFPQTESWAKKWWDWFSKLLLMYPFIMAFFGLSKVSAGIISKARGTDVATDIMYDLAAIALLILPYFFVGKALSLAGGAIGKVAGMVNNKDKGAIDRMKKWEAGKVSERRYDAARGQRYGGRNFVTRGINRTLRAGAKPSTVIGRQGDRNAAILQAVQENADTMESRNEGAKNLSKDQVRLLGSISDESQSSAVLDQLAKEKALAKGDTSSVGIAAERAALQASYNDAKNKVGGSVDTGTQLYALRKGVQDGSITPEEAQKAATELSQKLATGGSQQQRLADALHTQLDTMAAGAGYSTGNAVSREAQRARTGSASPPLPNDHVAVQRIYTGSSAASFDKLGTMKSSEFDRVSASKQQQVQNSVIDIGTAATPEESQNHVTALVGHVADLEVTRRAAVKAGNTELITQTRESIQAINDELQAAEARGDFGPHTTYADIQTRAAQEVAGRTVSTP